MRIIAAAADFGACTGYRIREPLNKIKKLQLAETILIESATTNIESEIKKSDIFMFGRAASGQIVTQIDKMHAMGKKVVFDLDDNIFDVSPFSQHYNRLGVMPMNMESDAGESMTMWTDGEKGFDIKSNRQFQMHFIRVLKNVDRVICTTSPLEKLYKRFNNNVTVVPNSIDVGVWKTDKLNVTDKPFRILWTGAANHYPDAVDMMPVFEEIQKKHKDVRFAFVGTDWRIIKNNLDYSRIDVYPWVSYETYPYLLKSINADIGIASIQKNDFDDCRSAIKWYEYSCLNIPTIATNHGPYKREMKNNETGLLVNDDKEWIKALSYLIENDHMRSALACQAYHEVRLNHNLDYTVDRWVEAFSNTLKDN